MKERTNEQPCDGSMADPCKKAVQAELRTVEMLKNHSVKISNLVFQLCVFLDPLHGDDVSFQFAG